MSNLLAKIVAPLFIAGNLFFAQPPKVGAENRSNIHFGIGDLSSANEDVEDAYGGLFGGTIGVDLRISEYFRSSLDFSAYSKKIEEKEVEHIITFSQFDSTIQFVSGELDGVVVYLGAGICYVGGQERASKGKESIEASDGAWGLVGKFGGESHSKKSNWGGYIGFSPRVAKKDDFDFGGTSFDIGAKYHFGN